MSRNKKRKYPDLVVYSEDKGFYSKELTYGSNVGAPAIKLEDVTGWKKTQALVQTNNSNLNTKN